MTIREHGWKRTYGAFIYCLCGWSHDSLFDWVNERALRRHIRTERGFP